MTGRVEAIYRYPVKGMTAHAMATVALIEGETLPFDRAYAIENGPGRFDESNPKTLARNNFLMLMRDERLAALDARFDDVDQTLSLFRSGKQVAKGDLTTTSGRVRGGRRLPSTSTTAGAATGKIAASNDRR